MWRSLGGSSGMGRGAGGGGAKGGGSGGDGVFRTVRRVARVGISNLPDALNSNNSSYYSSTTTPTSSKRGLRHCLSATATSQPPYSSSSEHQLYLSNIAGGFAPSWSVSPSSPSVRDEFEWVCSVGVGDDGSFDDYYYGPPSYHEAEDALLSLSQFVGSISHSHLDGDRTPYFGADLPDQVLNDGVLMRRIGSVSSDSDWKEPPLQICDQRIIQPHRLDRVYDALHMLETEPCVQRMVISLSTDRAVWNAILNNEAVQEFKASYKREDIITSPRSNENSDPPASSASVLTWMFDNMRVKFMELIANLTSLLNALFQPKDQEETGKYPDIFVEKVRAAFMLTSLIVLIVIVTRAHRAD